MNFSYRYILFSISICFCTKVLSQDKQAEENQKISLEAGYIGDAVANLHGGLETGASYLGLANLVLSVNTENIGWWKGGEFFINGANTHGGEPSSGLVGDFQGITNIEAGNLTYLQELWYSQTLGRFSLIVGLQDLNAEYASSEYGGLFINSSFGIHSTIADNIPSPIFPFTRPGVSFKINVNEKMLLQLAMYEGLIEEDISNEYNLNWDIESDGGAMYIGEFQSSYRIIKDLVSNYKLGIYHHHISNTSVVEGSENKTAGNLGFYLVADQEIIKNKGRAGGFGIFTQIGLSSSAVNNHNCYLGFGLNYSGISAKRSEDVVGLAIAHSRFKTSINGNETAIELNYKFFLNNNIFIQPDIQYVINPSGTEESLENAFVGILRFGFNFNSLKQ